MASTGQCLLPRAASASEEMLRNSQYPGLLEHEAANGGMMVSSRVLERLVNG